MSGWLLDTDVISGLRKPRPSARVSRFIASQRLDDLFVSAATALQHGLTVVTRDTSDDKLARVPLFNPWVDQST